MPMRKPFCTTAGWSELVINELQDWLCVLSPPPSPRFLHSTPSVLNHLGFTPEDMVGRQLVDFLHADDVDVFTREMATSGEATYAAVRAAPPSREFRTVNAEGCVHTTNPEAWGGVWPSDPQLDYCCPFRVYGRFRRKDGRLVMLELDGRPYFLNHPSPNGAPSPTCFFVVGRTYPSKPASLLDSFLELKMENERLKRRLEEMAAEDASREPTDSNETASTAIGSKSDSAASSERSASSAGLKHIHAAASASSTLQVNKQLLESEESSVRLEINSLSRTVISVSENNASVDMSSDIEENENVVGDSGSEQNLGNMKKRKKEKKDRREDDQGPSICVDCGALESPEWRKGPMGPKTLCNACGLRWAKKAKKAARASKDWDSLPTLLDDRL